MFLFKQLHFVILFKHPNNNTVSIRALTMGQILFQGLLKYLQVSSSQQWEVSIIIIPILQMRKLRPREAK